MKILKALTLWQPWASLIIYGDKRVENRPWFPPRNLVGQRIYIHAGLKYDDAAERRFPVEVTKLGEAARLHGCIIGSAVLAFTDTKSTSMAPETARYFFGPVGWVLEDIQAVVPIDCRGAQKLWNVPEKVRRALLAGDPRTNE